MELPIILEYSWALLIGILFCLAFFGLLGRIAMIATLGLCMASEPNFILWIILIGVGYLCWENNATTWWPSLKSFRDEKSSQEKE